MRNKLASDILHVARDATRSTAETSEYAERSRLRHGP